MEPCRNCWKWSVKWSLSETNCIFVLSMLACWLIFVLIVLLVKLKCDSDILYMCKCIPCMISPKRHHVSISFLIQLVQCVIEAQSVNRNKTYVPMFYRWIKYTYLSGCVLAASWFNSYGFELVLRFYSAINHGYICFISIDRLCLYNALH